MAVANGKDQFLKLNLLVANTEYLFFENLGFSPVFDAGLLSLMHEKRVYHF
jgi:hypothetical protein